MVSPFSIARKKLLVANFERKRGKIKFRRHPTRCSTETLHWTQYPTFSTIFQTHNSLHFFSCLKWPPKIDCFFVDNSQVLMNYVALQKAGSCFHANNKIQINPQAHFTPVNYPVTSAASFEFPDSAALTCKDTCWNIQVRCCKSLGVKNIYLSRVQFNFFNYQSTIW